MAQNVAVTLDLGKGADLGRLQLSFNAATSASPDTISDSKARIVSVVKLDKFCITMHLLLLLARQIVRSEYLPCHDDLVIRKTPSTKD
jgi:hypothetical protein